MDKTEIILSGIAAYVALGATSAVIMGQTASKYGHTFMQFAPSSRLLLGTLGAVQNLTALIFISALGLRKNNRDWDWQAVLTGHTLAGATVLALTALAAKVNLIAARLSLFAAIALTVAGFVEHFATRKCLKSLLANRE